METNNSVKLILNKVNKIEKIVNNFNNLSKKKIGDISKFVAKFTLNDIPYELKFGRTLESANVKNISPIDIHKAAATS